jgi:enoyl-[acyl-carrier-protein] reductase (NADH)
MVGFQRQYIVQGGMDHSTSQNRILLMCTLTEEELALSVLYLASPASDFTNGHVLVIDEGFSLVNPEVV